MYYLLPQAQPEGSPPILGYDPKGNPVHDVSQLPSLAEFDNIIAGEDQIEINGWVLPYRILSREALTWFHQHALALSRRNKKEKMWIENTCYSFQKQFCAFKQRLAGE